MSLAVMVFVGPDSLIDFKCVCAVFLWFSVGVFLRFRGVLKIRGVLGGFPWFLPNSENA